MNLKDISNFLKKIWTNENEVREIRLFHSQKNQIFRGYFDCPEKALNSIEKFNPKDFFCYITLNPCNPALLARANNRLLLAKKGESTKDEDIVSIQYLPVDIDPVRPSGIQANDEEIEAAKNIFSQLAEKYQFFMTCFSGNGFHGLLKVNNGTTSLAIKQELEEINQNYSTAKAKIDTSVYNPARIWKIAGTWSLKGDCLEDRPYRLSKILSCNSHAKVLTLVEKKIDKNSNNSSFTGNYIDNFLSKHNIAVKETKKESSRTIYILEHCIFDSSHTKKDAAIIVESNGQLGYHCFHNSCSNKEWKDVREHYEGAKEQKKYKCKCGSEIIYCNGDRCNIDGTYHTCMQTSGNIQAIEELDEENNNTMPTIPSFPLYVFPTLYQEYILNCCETFCSPALKPDYIAMSMLALVGAISGTTQLEIKQGWTCNPNLYVALVGEPGTKKSPCLSKALCFAKKTEAIYQEEYEEKLKEYKKDKKNYTALSSTQKKEQDEPEMPIRKHFLVNNPTVEALLYCLKNNKSLLLGSDELSSLISGFNQYKGGRGNDRQFYLSAFTNEAYSTIRVDNTKNSFVERPIITIVGGIQPDILSLLVGKQEDGLLQRFTFCCPCQNEKIFWSEKDQDPYVKQQIGEDLDFIRFNQTEKIFLSPEARGGLASFWEINNHEQKNISNLQKAIFWSKLDIQFTKMCCILSIIKKEKYSTPSTINGAIEIVEYLKKNIEKILYISDKSPKERKAEAIIVHMNKKNIVQISIRELAMAKLYKNTKKTREQVENLIKEGLATWIEPNKTFRLL